MNCTLDSDAQQLYSAVKYEIGIGVISIECLEMKGGFQIQFVSSDQGAFWRNSRSRLNHKAQRSEAC